MKRYLLFVDSVIGPLTAVSKGTSPENAFVRLKKDMKGATALIATKEEKTT